MEPDSWRVALDFAALALALASMAYAHWRTHERATHKDIEALEVETQSLRDRLGNAEARLEYTPTSQALHEVALSNERLAGELKKTTAELHGLGEIVLRLDRITERQESYLLNKGAG